MKKFIITESEKESIKNMYDLKEDGSLVDSSVDAFKKLLSMLQNWRIKSSIRFTC